MSWVIRSYQSGDFSDCVDVMLSNTPQFFDHSEIDEFKSDLISREASPIHKRWPYFVLVTNDKVRACGGFFVKSKDRAGLIWGMVSRDDHKSGLGSALITYRLSCLAPCIQFVDLDTTPESFGFFEKHGFEQVGFEKEGYGPGLDKILALKKRF